MQANVQSITAQVMASAGLTATGLTDLLLSVDREASEGAKARLRVILDSFGNIPLQDGRKIMAEAAKAAKGQPTEQTLRQRLSECRQLVGAVRLIEGFRKGIEEAGMGWASCVSRARVELAEKGLKANGDRVKSKEEIAGEKQQAAIVATLAEEMAGLSQEQRRDSGTVAELAAKAAETVAELGASKAAVKKHAEQIIKLRGMAYAVELSNCIVSLYDETQDDDSGEEAAE